jgi:hypothetical protein
MKQAKSFFLLALTLCIAFLPFEGVQAASDLSPDLTGYTNASAADFEYHITGSGAVLDNYVGKGVNIILPSSVGGKRVTVVGDAFRESKTVEGIVIPDSVKTLDAWAFTGASNLKSVYIGKNVKSIEYRAFIKTPSLVTIAVDRKNTNFTIKDGVLFNKKMTVLVQFPTADERTSYIVPDSVTEIEGYAFYSCNPGTVTLPDSLETIGYASFEHCYNLKQITVPDSVTHIGSWAFTKNGLESITIGKGVQNISDTVFMDTHSLKEMRFMSPTPPEHISENAFDSAAEGARVIVPAGSKKYGKEGDLWNGMIVTVDD